MSTDRIRIFLKKNGKDIIVFIMSLLLAFSIWLIHGLSQKYTELVKVPVRAVSNISGHSDKSVGVATVMARCRATGFELIRLNKRLAHNAKDVTFDVADLKHVSGENYSISSNELNRYAQAIFGDKVSLESFVSDTLIFRFPVENSKKVPVQPVVRLSFKSQYTNVGPLRIIPDSVVVYGEPYHLDKISRVYTQAFNLEDLDAPVHGEVALDAIKGVRKSTERVEYFADVQRYVELTGDFDVNVVNVPRGKTMIVYPPTAKVTFKCAFPLSINPLDKVHIIVDYNDFVNSLGGECIARLDRRPEGILNYVIEPQVFSCVESEK